MGNCIETWSSITISQKAQAAAEEEEEEEEVKPQKQNEKHNIRVKIVLTKDELEWLMLKLKNSNNEGKRLEEILQEIEQSRKKRQKSMANWRPSLDSIFESPEVPDTMDG